MGRLRMGNVPRINHSGSRTHCFSARPAKENEWSDSNIGSVSSLDEKEKNPNTILFLHSNID